MTQDNFIDTSGDSVLLVINSATKVKHTVTINVSEDCPVLAELLKSITLDHDPPTQSTVGTSTDPAGFSPAGFGPFSFRVSARERPSPTK